jgi:tRNA(Ile)-lysidine synthase
VFRSSKNLERSSQFINDYVKGIEDKFVVEKKDSLRIKISLFESYDDWIAGEVIKSALRRNFNCKFEFGAYVKTKALFENQKGKSVQLGSKLLCVREKDYLVFLNQKDDENVKYEIKPGAQIKTGNIILGVELVDKKSINFESGGKVEYVDADKLSDVFILRTWKKGDKFFPLGMKNKKNVSDFLTDLKIETSERRTKLVLENGNNIVWVVGLRIDERYKINSKTKIAYKLWTK